MTALSRLLYFLRPVFILIALVSCNNPKYIVYGARELYTSYDSAYDDASTPMVVDDNGTNYPIMMLEYQSKKGDNKRANLVEKQVKPTSQVLNNKRDSIVSFRANPHSK